MALAYAILIELMTEDERVSSPGSTASDMALAVLGSVLAGLLTRLLDGPFEGSGGYQAT